MHNVLSFFLFFVQIQISILTKLINVIVAKILQTQYSELQLEECAVDLWSVETNIPLLL